MTAIVNAATSLFNFFFHVSTGTGDTVPAGVIPVVIDLFEAQPFLLVGVGLMLIGAAVSYLSRLIHT